MAGESFHNCSQYLRIPDNSMTSRRYRTDFFQSIWVSVSLYCLLALLFCCAGLCAGSSGAFITRQPWRGRLGDHLLSYIGTKALARRYNLHYLYTPFISSDQFVLHDEELCPEPHHEHFDRVILLRSVQQLERSEAHRKREGGRVLYIAAPHLRYEGELRGKFREEMRRLIAPRGQLASIDMPHDAVTIALHIRTGGDHPPDKRARVRKKSAHKFSRISSAIGVLQRLVPRVARKKVYIHIFTDDSNPARLAQHVASHLDNPDVEIGYRREGNHYDANVLEDLFGMMQCDYLIRTQSCFSAVAALLGRHKKVFIY